ncbi:MAG: hypothetical protein FWH15_01180 [Betaproteobacteria bacterium]|nr:hypothetical protein [Betaproteobacteria bacterium]
MSKITGKICLSVFALLGISACALLPRQDSDTTSIASTQDKAAIQDAAPGDATIASSRNATQPDAVFFLPPEAQPLPAEVTQSLQEVLVSLRGRENILFTLTAWPIADGSREVNIGLARQAATRLRDQLVKMGVRPYRIKTSVRGEAPDDSPSTPEKQRVDLFLSALTS